MGIISVFQYIKILYKILFNADVLAICTSQTLRYVECDRFKPRFLRINVMMIEVSLQPYELFLHMLNLVNSNLYHRIHFVGTKFAAPH